MTHLILTAVLSALSAQEQLDGAEIGDATHYVAFESGGKYRAETTPPKKGQATVAQGTWKVTDSTLEVTISSCKGPACDVYGKSYKAEVAVLSDRAVTMRVTPEDGALKSGSYYCSRGGCEKRLGVSLVTHGAKPLAMRSVLDFLIDKNVPRTNADQRADMTVVWWGRRIADKAPQHQLLYCARDPERGKHAAEQVARDLAELPWIGKLEPKPGPKDCLYDAQLVVADTTEPPARR
jgi:hypothetical protein